MALGFLLTIPSGILVEKENRDHQTHALCGIIGYGLVTYGFYVIYDNKETNGRSHFER